jgi:hypothetical protein
MSSNNSSISTPIIIQGNINKKSIICNFIDNFVEKINKKRKFWLYNDSTIFEKFFKNLIDRGFFKKIKENYCGKTYKSFNSSIRSNENFNTKMKNEANNMIKNSGDKLNNIIEKFKNMPFYFYFNTKIERNGTYYYYVIKLCFNDQYFNEMENFFNEGTNIANLPNEKKDIVDVICSKKALLKKNPYLFCVKNIEPTFYIIPSNKKQTDITGCGMNYLSILSSSREQNKNNKNINVIEFKDEVLYPYLLPYFTYNNLTLKGILKNAELVYSTFTNVTFNTSELRNSIFEHSTFTDVTFDINIFNKNKFFKCNFINTTFKITDDTNIKFEECNFENTTIDKTKLELTTKKYFSFIHCTGNETLNLHSE